MNPITDIVRQLIVGEVRGELPPASLCASLSETEWKELYDTAVSHDMAHLVGDAVNRMHCPLTPQQKTQFRRQVFTAVYRHEISERELQSVRALLEEAGIPFTVLKGMALRDRYPQPWMRTSCDIDLLVDRRDLAAARRLLTERCSYTVRAENHHDVTLVSPTKVALELHFSLDEQWPMIDGPLEQVPAYLKPVSPGKAERVMDPEFRLFYWAAHAAYHVLNGGCGIRSLLDLYILRNMPVDEATFRDLLAQAQLQPFFAAMERLMRVWFDGAEPTELTETLEAYLWSGGLFGEGENRVAMGQARHNGKVRAMFAKVWMPRESLVTLYPALAEHPRRLPWYEVCRWFRAVRRSRFKDGWADLLANAALGDEASRSAVYLFRTLGLDGE